MGEGSGPMENDSTRTSEELAATISVDARALMSPPDVLSPPEEPSESTTALAIPEPRQPGALVSLATRLEDARFPFVDFTVLGDSGGRPLQGARTGNLSLLSFAQNFDELKKASDRSAAAKAMVSGAQALAGHNVPIVWLCVGPVAALLALVVVVIIFRSADTQHEHDAKDKSKKRAANRGNLTPHSSVACRRFPRGMKDYAPMPSDSAPSGSDSQLSTARSPLLSGSDLPRCGDHAAAAHRAGGASQQADAPLCVLLVVPENTRLACVVQSNVCRVKQELTFHITGLSSCGGKPLFQIRVSDKETSPPGIFAESLDGKDQLAFISTEELWQGSSYPVLRIVRPSGAAYGTMQKTEAGDYRVYRGGVELLRFTGDFAGHNVQVSDASGRAVANTWQTSPEEYQAHVYALCDASLVIIGFVAIDKCEMSSSNLTPRGS